MIENYVVTTTELKPLILFKIVLENNIRSALVFTKSTESAGRLLKLWDCFEAKRTVAMKDTSDNNGPIVARAYSSDLSPALRKATLQDFKTGSISILICSDLISRGVDIPSIMSVISYDAPIDMRKYVHRSGRTARAGREGTAWTLLEEQEARHFKIMMKEADHLQRIKKVRISETKLSDVKQHYEEALRELQSSDRNEESELSLRAQSTSHE